MSKNPCWLNLADGGKWHFIIIKYVLIQKRITNDRVLGDGRFTFGRVCFRNSITTKAEINLQDRSGQKQYKICLRFSSIFVIFNCVF